LQADPPWSAAKEKAARNATPRMSWLGRWHIAERFDGWLKLVVRPVTVRGITYLTSPPADGGRAKESALANSI